MQIVNICILEIWNIPSNICKIGYLRKISAFRARPLRLSANRFGPVEAGLRRSLANQWLKI